MLSARQRSDSCACTRAVRFSAASAPGKLSGPNLRGSSRRSTSEHRDKRATMTCPCPGHTAMSNGAIHMEKSTMGTSVNESRSNTGTSVSDKDIDNALVQRQRLLLMRNYMLSLGCP